MYGSGHWSVMNVSWLASRLMSSWLPWTSNCGQEGFAAADVLNEVATNADSGPECKGREGSACRQ